MMRAPFFEHSGDFPAVLSAAVISASPSGVLADQTQKFRLSDNANFLALIDKFFCATVLAAFGVTRQQGYVLVSDYQQGDFFGDTCSYSDACTSSISAGFDARKTKFPCEASDMPIKRATLVAFNCDRRLKRFRGLCSWSREFSKCFPGMIFRHKDNLSGSICVLTGVMVLKIKVEEVLEVGQSVSAIPLKLWPRPLRNGNAINPCGSKFWQTIAITGTVKGAFVKATVLHQCISFEEGAQNLDCFGESRFPGNFGFVNPVKVGIEIIKAIFGVDQQGCAFNAIGMVHKSKANLADAGWIGVRGFDIEGNKAKCLIKFIKKTKIIFLMWLQNLSFGWVVWGFWMSSQRWLQVRGIELGFFSAKEALEKLQSNNLSSFKMKIVQSIVDRNRAVPFLSRSHHDKLMVACDLHPDTAPKMLGLA